jgi:hypothetical protein
VGAELLHADRQTDMTKLIVTFRTFANAPKNGSYRYKNVDTIHKVMLTYSRIKFVDVPLFILFVVTCIETCSIEVFNPNESSPCAMY